MSEAKHKCCWLCVTIYQKLIVYQWSLSGFFIYQLAVYELQNIVYLYTDSMSELHYFQQLQHYTMFSSQVKSSSGILKSVLQKKTFTFFSSSIVAGQMVQILLFNHPRSALSIFSLYALFWRYHIFVFAQAFRLRRYFKGKHWNFPSKGGKILSPCRKDMFLFKKNKKKKPPLGTQPSRTIGAI